MKFFWCLKLAGFIFLFCACSSFEEIFKAPPSFAKVLWVRPLVPMEKDKTSVYQRIKPVLASGLVIQGHTHGVVALTQSKGKTLWSFDLKGGVAGGVLVEKGQVFFAAGEGFVYALDLKTGAVLWKRHTGLSLMSRPTLWRGSLYISSPFGLYVYEARTGKVQWSHKDMSSSLNHQAEFMVQQIAPPLVTARGVYYRTGEGYLWMLDHRGRLKWKKQLSDPQSRFASVASAPVIHRGVLFVSDFHKGLYALKPQTGKVLWTYALGSYTHPVVNASSHLFYPGTGGKIVALSWEGKQIWSKDLKSSTATSLVPYRDMLIYGEYSGSALKLVSQKTGRSLGGLPFGSGVVASPQMHQNKKELYFLSRGAYLYKVKLVL